MANTLAAVAAGCVQVQGTINGIGERCGNVDLISVIANAELEASARRCLPDGNLRHLTEISRLVLWERSNLQGATNQPYGQGPRRLRPQGAASTSAPCSATP